LEHFWNMYGPFCDVVGTTKHYHIVVFRKTVSLPKISKGVFGHTARFWKRSLQKTTMKKAALRKKILVLCDHDALYSAIEMNLTGLPQTSIKRSAFNLAELKTALTLPEAVDLIILATVSPIADLGPVLIDLLSGSRIGKPIVMMISEHLFVPELGDRMTFLNFPFDMDGLPVAVAKILGGGSSTGPLKSVEKEV
jgi:hypothetical protein